MGRLIDADKVKDKVVFIVKGLISMGYTQFATVLHIAVNIIDSSDTIDPVKHGKWIYKYTVVDGVRKSSYLFCGECGEQVDDESTYCKHCGTKMDAGYEHYDIDYWL